jgi:hypothetical protein
MTEHPPKPGGDRDDSPREPDATDDQDYQRHEHEELKEAVDEAADEAEHQTD